MKAKDLRKKLLDDFGLGLEEFGFNKKPKQNSFYRLIEGGWVAVHVSCINHIDDFDVTVSTSIRFDKIEDVVNAENIYINEKEKKQTSTLGVELGNLSRGEQLRWNISSEEDLAPVVGSMLAMYQEFGQPYTLKYQSIKEVYNLLSRDDSDVWIHSPFHHVRAVRAVAAALLLERSDIETLVSSKKTFLEKRNDPHLPDFMEFEKYINRLTHKPLC